MKQPPTEAVRIRQLANDVCVLKQRVHRGLAVNVYVLSGEGGPCLVDAGYPGRAGELLAALESLGHRAETIRRIFYTHTHIDHMGGSADWAECCDAEHVVWHRSGSALTNWDAHYREVSDWVPWMEGLIEDEAVNALLEPPVPTPPVCRTAPGRLRLVREGDVLAAGRFQLQPVPAPGHDPQHIVWWDRRRRVAFSGDVVLPIPTPIVRFMGDDLGTYLDSLDRLEGLGVDTAYPGHGAQMPRFRERVARSRRFVEERHAQILDCLAQQSARSTVYRLAVALGGPPTENLARFSLFLANVESSVHYLHQTAAVLREGNQVSLPRRAP